MKVVQSPPWQHVTCRSCQTGLEISLSDIQIKTIGHDDEGAIRQPIVICPTCKRSINLSGKGVPIETLVARQRERQRWEDHDL